VELDLDLAGAPDTPLDYYWSRVVGAGRANEGLRAHWQRQLADAHRLGGFGYVRFHGLFHGDMFVYREIGGAVARLVAEKHDRAAGQFGRERAG
jgi:xylan 1,4-beta-xylosidase